MQTFSQSVPANLGRSFRDRFSALEQSQAHVSLSEGPEGLIYNSSFRPELIKWDDDYSTTNASNQGAWNIDIASNLVAITNPHSPNANFVEIGCGQGEVVRGIQALGYTCLGFDPAIKKPSEGLYKTIFIPGESKLSMSPDVFIMRCVLPHLTKPDYVLNQIFRVYQEALIYVEYQDFSTTVKSGAFWQISHDHVNYFTTDWFEDKFNLVDSGKISGEWSWVLVGSKSQIDSSQGSQPNTMISQVSTFSRLQESKKDFLTWAAAHQPLVVLGAGGKGANLGFQLVKEEIKVSVVDLDPSKQKRFLECSGLEVFPYSHLQLEAKNATKVLLNPSYRDEVRTLLGSSKFETFGS